jgi:hypothetical protein
LCNLGASLDVEEEDVEEEECSRCNNKYLTNYYKRRKHSLSGILQQTLTCF